MLIDSSYTSFRPIMIYAMALDIILCVRLNMYLVYSTFTNVFLFLSRFTLNVFLNFNLNVFTCMVLGG